MRGYTVPEGDARAERRRPKCAGVEALEYVVCPNCQSDDASLHRVAHDRLFSRPGEYKTVRCKPCGLIYTNPRPTFESLARHYPDEYFCYTPPESLSGLRKFFLRQTQREVTDQRLRAIERVTGRLRPGTRICDVGCAYGELLSAFKKRRGCDVIGVDINATAIERCARSGIAAKLGTLEDATLDAESCDLVTMTEYLEHEPNPKRVLEECRRISKSRAFLAVEVPLCSGFVARVFGNYWSQLDLPRHLIFFTPSTLENMLRSVGYELVSLETKGGTIGLSLLNALGYEGIGELRPRDIVLMTLANLPFAPFAALLPEFMFVVARRID